MSVYSAPVSQAYFEERECTYRVGRLVADVGHDRDEHMLLNGERAGVELDAKDLDIGQESCPKSSKRECKQLCHDLHRCMVYSAMSSYSCK